MGDVSPTDPPNAMKTRLVLLGVILLGLGLLLHLLSARAIGGSYVAYRDHILGFVGLTLASGAVIAALGWRFWKGRRDITLLILGAMQTIIGVLVYINRFSVHG
jgi:hypothetical protein